jgi:hypothetical protein
MELSTKTSMHAKYFIINQGSDRQLFKYAYKFFEKSTISLISSRQRRFRFSLPFQKCFIETINISKTVALMIASEQEKILWIFYFKSKQEQNSLYLHGAPSLIVSKEQIISFWWPSLHIEYFSEV